LIASRRHLEQAARTFEKSVTLVKNERNVLPLSPEIPADKVAILALSSDNDDYFAGQTFVRELRKRKPGMSAFYADANTGRNSSGRRKQKPWLPTSSSSPCFRA